MNKKIMAIGIIAMFLLTGFTAVSAVTVKQLKNVEKADVSTAWTRFGAWISFSDLGNLEVTINGDPVDINNLRSDLTYENVVITGTQEEPSSLLPSFATAFFSRFGLVRDFPSTPLVNLILAIMFVITHDAEKSMKIMWQFMGSLPQFYTFEPGPFTITMGKMDQCYLSMGDMAPIAFRGWNTITISQN